ncbi:uncharacterized protein B0H18DRAFT_958989 [Fomitopsis serialis]|uniref:uncharacterized protein n=1 Tax=Fomitopsis serialis TaxID=139415 RepID=UPI0020082E67|nr:uncharacterized protein B0H18DRAFT_958989 [Neoantrodia serialis]KAH9916061.1 hypothetical protein B0H18DRAFT_958989 [Neoantrodia serialis]
MLAESAAIQQSQLSPDGFNVCMVRVEVFVGDPAAVMIKLYDQAVNHHPEWQITLACVILDDVPFQSSICMFKLSVLSRCICYIEVQNPKEIQDTLQYASQQRYQYHMQIVNKHDYCTLFQCALVRVSTQSLVLFKHGLYKGDTTYVESVSNNNSTVIVWCIPRINLCPKMVREQAKKMIFLMQSPATMQSPAVKQSTEIQTVSSIQPPQIQWLPSVQPPPILFHSEDVIDFYGKAAVQVKHNTFKFHGTHFIGSLLWKSVKISHLSPQYSFTYKLYSAFNGAPQILCAIIERLAGEWVMYGSTIPVVLSVSLVF